MNTNRSCHFCKSEEGKPRPVGNYIVELKQINVHGIKKLACQSCHRKTTTMLTKEQEVIMKTSTKTRIQNFVLKMTGLFMMLVFTSITAVAQSAPGLPMFPDDPAAAPIDGGISLLAAAGGAYAIKKLRDKSKE